MHPEWDMDNQFVIEELHPVLTIDATLASHPIFKSVESLAEITEYFDTITYPKGAALVRMLENLEERQEASWIQIDANQLGNYRVNYAREQWMAFISALNNIRESFSTADRAHLLNDANTLAAAAQLEPKILDIRRFGRGDRKHQMANGQQGSGGQMISP